MTSIVRIHHSHLQYRWSLLCNFHTCPSSNPVNLDSTSFSLTSFQLHFPVSHPHSALLSDHELRWPLQQHFFLFLPSKYSACHWNNLYCGNHFSQFHWTSLSLSLLLSFTSSYLKYWDMTKQILLGWCCLHTCPYALSCLFRSDSVQGSSWYSLNLISSLTPTFLLLSSASNVPTSSNNVSDMIDFSVRVFAFSSSNCINFCSHACILLLALCCVFGLYHVSPLMITECVTLEVERVLLIPCLEVQIADRVHVPRDWHEKKDALNIRHLPELVLCSFTHCCISNVSFGHSSPSTLWPWASCCASYQSRSAALSWTRCQSPCSFDRDTRSACRLS